MLSISYNTRAVMVAAAMMLGGLTTNTHAAQGDPVAGKQKAALCGSCHGIDGNSNDATSPRLAGQYAGYIAKQIGDFQKGHRTNSETMSGMAATLGSKQDAWDIGAYFQQQTMKGKLTKTDSTLAAKGEKLFRKGNPTSGIYGCINCHGESGKGKSEKISVFPVIGGQHRDYIMKQLQNFRTGERNNDPAGMMNMIAEKLTDDEIKAVAEYLSSQL